MSIEPLSQDLLVRTVKMKGVKYLIDNDDDVLMRYKGDSPFGDTDIYLSIVGENKNILKAFAIFENQLSKQKLPEAVFLCNQFHMQYSFPCVYVQIPESSEDPAKLWSQMWLSLNRLLKNERAAI